MQAAKQLLGHGAEDEPLEPATPVACPSPPGPPGALRPWPGSPATGLLPGPPSPRAPGLDRRRDEALELGFGQLAGPGSIVLKQDRDPAPDRGLMEGMTWATLSPAPNWRARETACRKAREEKTEKSVGQRIFSIGREALMTDLRSTLCKRGAARLAFPDERLLRITAGNPSPETGVLAIPA